MKNKLIYFIMLVGVFTFFSCNTDIPVTPGIDDFDVTTESLTYKVGENVSFKMKGNPDMITFYSGEPFHEYAYSEGRIIQLDSPMLSFTTSKPVTARAQEDQFRVVISTDFNGDYSSFSSIESATWTDITHLFTITTTITFTPSGVVDLSDYVEKGKPFYIAYRYILRPMEYGRAGTWHVQSFSFFADTAVGRIILGDMKTAGFQFVEQNPEIAQSRSRMTATRITFWGYEQTEENNIHAETWAVSTGFNVEAIDKGPDKPIAIKSVQSVMMDSYDYIYTEPGVYKATFVATNGNVHNLERTIKEVTVTVEP